MIKRVMLIIILLLAAPLSMAAANTIAQSIHQVTEGSTSTGQFTVTQRANVFGTIAGENDYLSQDINQYFRQDIFPIGLPFNSSNPANFTNVSSSGISHNISAFQIEGTGSEGFFNQDSRLAAMISGNDNVVSQNSSQVMINNDLHGGSRITQLDRQLALIVSSKSTVNQSTSQRAVNNKLNSTTLDQIANETAIIIGNTTSVQQVTLQDFSNSTSKGSTQKQNAALSLLVAMDSSAIGDARNTASEGLMKANSGGQELVRSTQQGITVPGLPQDVASSIQGSSALAGQELSKATA